MPFTAAPSATVANSSSESATDPVRRTFTPFSGVSPSLDAASRITAVALRPGCRSSKSRTGWMFTNRRRSEGSGARPVISLRQEKAGIFPCARSSSASASAVSAGLRSSSFAFPRRTPSSDCDSVRNTPRSVGSAASVPRKGCAEMRSAVVRSNLVDTEEEDAVALEELAAIGTADRSDHIRARRKRIHQRIGGIIGGLRRRRVDDRNDLIDALWKCRIEHPLLLAPRQRARQELVAVGGDDEMPCKIAGRDYCQQQQREDHRPRMAARQLHQLHDRSCRRRVVICLCGLSWDGSIARLNGNSLDAI